MNRTTRTLTAALLASAMLTPAYADQTSGGSSNVTVNTGNTAPTNNTATGGNGTGIATGGTGNGGAGGNASANGGTVNPVFINAPSVGVDPHITATNNSSINNKNTADSTALSGSLSNSGATASTGPVTANPTATATNGPTTSNSGGNTQGQTFDYTNKNPAATAIAPQGSSSGGACPVLGYTSLGAQFLGFGISGGSNWHNSFCEGQYLVGVAQGMHKDDIAHSLLCQDERWAKADATCPPLRDPYWKGDKDAIVIGK